MVRPRIIEFLMPFTQHAKFKVDLKKYKALVVDVVKSSKNAKLVLLQGEKEIAVVQCGGETMCQEGGQVTVPLMGVDPLAYDLKLVGDGDIQTFSIAKLV
jgi:hypothetical protein